MPIKWADFGHKIYWSQIVVGAAYVKLACVTKFPDMQISIRFSWIFYIINMIEFPCVSVRVLSPAVCIAEFLSYWSDSLFFGGVE